MKPQTKNKYSYPVEIKNGIRMSYHDSPAHVGDLTYSVDFICKEGTPILAAASGIVFDVKSDSNIGGPGKELEEFGNYIEIKHKNNEISEYEHLKEKGVLVEVGEKVKKGQIIGYTGATGWLAHLGPHLHFMVGKYENNEKDFKTLKISWENKK